MEAEAYLTCALTGELNASRVFGNALDTLLASVFHFPSATTLVPTIRLPSAVYDDLLDTLISGLGEG